MNRLKDFFYNKNDVIIVLVILIVAGFLIYNRIGAIMDYPAKLADSMAKNETTQTVETTTQTTTTEPTDEASDDNGETQASSDEEGSDDEQ